MANESDLLSMNGLRSAVRQSFIEVSEEREWYWKFDRFTMLNAFNKLTGTKEYVFFTKPDCHIYTPYTTTLQPVLKEDPFFIDLANRYPHVIQQLQSSAGGEPRFKKSPFMNLLSNTIKSSVDLQALSAAEMDGPKNMYGSGINYRKDAWTGDEDVSFSIEFEDSKYLEVYMLVKAYEEYKRYCTMGLIYPPNLDGSASIGSSGANANSYVVNKILHDVFGIYRFVVEDDYETLVYWSYVCGAYFNSVPRDAFNDIKGGSDLSFSVDFKAFLAFDMDPRILTMFDTVVTKSLGDRKGYRRLYPYNSDLKGIDYEWATYPYIFQVNESDNPKAWRARKDMKYVYKLAWYTSMSEKESPVYKNMAAAK